MSKASTSLDESWLAGRLRQIESVSGIGSRIEAVSQWFLGHPYRCDPLIGSRNRNEEFTISFDGFDCVTYVETVLALARAGTPEEFLHNLRHIRYASGRVDWRKRHHYMTRWIRENARQGIVSNRTRGACVRERRRRLDVVDGLRASTVRVRSIPKRQFIRQAADVKTGDLVFFASTRQCLDVFHCGILVPNRALLLRHASRSGGHVMEQNLSEFLDANRMSGIILVRPLELGWAQ